MSKIPKIPVQIDRRHVCAQHSTLGSWQFHRAIQDCPGYLAGKPQISLFTYPNTTINFFFTKELKGRFSFLNNKVGGKD